MEKLVEVNRVEETRHIVPNLARLTAAFFGMDSYFLDWHKSHIHWATQKSKHPDGLVWCPWKRELWLVEAEWKEGSNFFDQCGSFASGRVNRATLSDALRDCLKPFQDVVNSASATHTHNLGYVLDKIVEETLDRHFKGDELQPHMWVVLGHDGDNIEKLRADYERVLQAWFRERQKYILTMVRMFQSECTTFLLLEQHCPSNGSVDRAILLPAVSQAVVTPMCVEATTHEITNVSKSPASVLDAAPIPFAAKGKAAELLDYIRRREPNLEPSMLRLRIYANKDQYYDFPVSWNCPGKVLMVEYKGYRFLPAHAAKKAMPHFSASNTRSVPYSFGRFVDISVKPAKMIATYKSFVHKRPCYESETDSIHGIDDIGLANGCVHGQSQSYFYNMTPKKTSNVKKYILRQQNLWKAFLEKKELSRAEVMKLLVGSSTRDISRFMTMNRLVTEFADIFTLNDAVVPDIKSLLAKPKET